MIRVQADMAGFAVQLEYYEGGSHPNMRGGRWWCRCYRAGGGRVNAKFHRLGQFHTEEEATRMFDGIIVELTAAFITGEI